MRLVQMELTVTERHRGRADLALPLCKKQELILALRCFNSELRFYFFFVGFFFDL